MENEPCMGFLIFLVMQVDGEAGDNHLLQLRLLIHAIFSTCFQKFKVLLDEYFHQFTSFVISREWSFADS